MFNLFKRHRIWAILVPLYLTLVPYVICTTAQKSLSGQASSDVWVVGVLFVGGVGGMVGDRRWLRDKDWIRAGRR